MISDTILVLVVTTSALLVGSTIKLALKLCYSSRCKKFECCGLVNIERDTAREVNLDPSEFQTPQQPQTNSI